MLDTLSVRVGERGKLVMRVEPALDSSDQIHGYRAVLRIDPEAIFIHEVVSPDRAVTGDAARLQVGSNGTVTVERAAGSPILIGTELFRLELEGLATGKPLNVVSIDQIELFGAPKTASMGQGLVILSGCEVGLNFGKRVRIERIMPNPVYEGAVLEYRAPAGSVPELRLLDANGNERRVRVLEIGTGEMQAVRLDLDEESSGMYMLELRDGAERVVLPIVIQK